MRTQVTSQLRVGVLSRTRYHIPRSIVVIATLISMTSLAGAQTNSIVRPASQQDSSIIVTENTSDTSDGETTTVELRHRFEAGEKIRWIIEHTATTETRIQGNAQASRMRTVSTRQWEVLDVNEAGQISLVQSVEDVQMTSKLSDRPEVTFDSTSGEEPPEQYAGVPDTIGVPLATFTFDPQGADVERESDLPPQDLGLGDIVIPLPEGPIAVGTIWDSPNQLYARDENGERVLINTRQRYALREVKTGIAYIAVQTQLVTPVNSPRIRAQVMQQMTTGTILFDIEKGRVWRQEFDWNEQVIGFDTPDSLMTYNARYVQTLDDGRDDHSSAPVRGTNEFVESPNTTSNSIRLAEELPQIRR